MNAEVYDTLLESVKIGFSALCLGNTRVIFESSGGSDKNNRVRLESRETAFYVEELLRAGV